MRLRGDGKATRCMTRVHSELYGLCVHHTLLSLPVQVMEALKGVARSEKLALPDPLAGRLVTASQRNLRR